MNHIEHYKIETLKLSDYQAVRRLWLRTEGVGLNEADSRSNIALYLKRNPGMSFVARHRRRIVGAILCGHDGRRGYLQHLAVAPRHRRRGLAGQMISACLVELSRAGITRCNLYLFRDNPSGARFWRHNGWKLRADLCVMQKPLAARKGKRGIRNQR